MTMQKRFTKVLHLVNPSCKYVLLQVCYLSVFIKGKKYYADESQYELKKIF